MTQTQQSMGKRTATLKRNGLTVECFFGNNGKLERKIERYAQKFTEYAYQYDAKGHLTGVKRDGTVTEEYQYNQKGQRVEQKREYRGFSDNTGGLLGYDDAGRLLRAGDVSFYYDRSGALSERCDCRGITRYFYGKDTMLDKVALPSGTEIRYEYDKSNPLGPARRYRSGILTAELAWADPLRLATYRDHDTLLEYAFQYDDSGILNKVRLSAFRPGRQGANQGEGRGEGRGGNRDEGQGGNQGDVGSDWLSSLAAQKRRERLHGFLGKQSLPLELFCGCDQVGTVKTLTDKNGRLIKEVLRDSFGVQCNDSLPDLFMPIGFAGGLVDPDTGLTRFGYRDYDPSVGRFTAPDPLGDTGGDHDVYDYCVDDPVSMNDPSGLFPPALLLLLGGKALALGLAAAGTYGAAWVADKLKSMRDGKKSTVAIDAVNKVAPIVAAASAASTVKGALTLQAGLATLGSGAAELATPVGHYLGAKLHASKYGAMALAAAPRVKDFIEGANDSGTPPMTFFGGLGYAAGAAYKKAKEWE